MVVDGGAREERAAPALTAQGQVVHRRRRVVHEGERGGDRVADVVGAGDRLGRRAGRAVAPVEGGRHVGRSGVGAGRVAPAARGPAKGREGARGRAGARVGQGVGDGEGARGRAVVVDGGAREERAAPALTAQGQVVHRRRGVVHEGQLGPRVGVAHIVGAGDRLGRRTGRAVAPVKGGRHVGRSGVGAGRVAPAARGPTKGREGARGRAGARVGQGVGDGEGARGRAVVVDGGAREERAAPALTAQGQVVNRRARVDKNRWALCTLGAGPVRPVGRGVCVHPVAVWHIRLSAGDRTARRSRARAHIR